MANNLDIFPPSEQKHFWDDDISVKISLKFKVRNIKSYLLQYPKTMKLNKMGFRTEL